MTYEEKLQKIVSRLKDERDLTRKGYKTKVTFDDSSFTKIRIQDICKILLKLQDDEKILTILDAYQLADTLDPYDKAKDENYDDVEIIDVELSEGFDSWYENYLMGQKTSLENLDFINMLRIYDIVQDINEQVQLTHKTTVHINLLPSLIRYRVLFPADTIGFRDEYCQQRLNSLKYLKEKDVIIDYSHGRDGWDTIITVSFILSRFDEFHKAIMEEYVKQNKPDGNTVKAQIDKSTKPQATTLTKVSYDSQKGVLNIEGKTVKLQKDSFRAKLLELLLKDNRNSKKEWSWDEIIEKLEGTLDENSMKESKKKFYPACDGLAKFIAQKTGVNDLLLFNKSTAQINPKYI